LDRHLVQDCVAKSTVGFWMPLLCIFKGHVARHNLETRPGMAAVCCQM
jgi:hypothetical protein